MHRKLYTQVSFDNLLHNLKNVFHNSNEVFIKPLWQYSIYNGPHLSGWTGENSSYCKLNRKWHCSCCHSQSPGQQKLAVIKFITSHQNLPQSHNHHHIQPPFPPFPSYSFAN